uniref:Ribosomal protein S13 n=1 Tax=Piridium sociabile TaxID=2570542 RepID=A0A5B9XXJ3_9ALVE|nr:ribosomal protein S13 [Piridium sociabile]
MKIIKLNNIKLLTNICILQSLLKLKGINQSKILFILLRAHININKYINEFTEQELSNLIKVINNFLYTYK